MSTIATYFHRFSLLFTAAPLSFCPLDRPQLAVESSVEPVCIILFRGPRAECCVLSKASKRLPLNRAPAP